LYIGLGEHSTMT